MDKDNYVFQRIVSGELEANMYLLWSKKNGKAIVIDPGHWDQSIEDKIEKLEVEPVKILLTHAHIDHCGGVTDIADRYGIPVLMNEKDIPTLNSPVNLELGRSLGISPPEKIDKFVKEGDMIQFNGSTIKIIETPGHTPGSICIMTQGLLFTGDTLFYSSIGRTDLPGGDFTEITRSLERIKNLPHEMIVLPGHGETTTISDEIRMNPFL